MNQFKEERRFARLLFSALVIVFGLQSMRFLFGSMTWYLRDTLGIGVLDLIPIAFAPFLLAALLPILGRWAGIQSVKNVGVGLLIAARLLNQITTSPAIDFFSSAVAVFAFVALLPVLMSLGRQALVGGLLLGLAIDSAIKGLGLSLDLAYQPGWRANIAVVAIALALLWAMNGSGTTTQRGVGWGSGLTLLGFAPFLFVQLLVLQSQGWTSAVAEMSGPAAQLRISLLNVVAIYLAARFAKSRALLAISTLVVVATVFVADGDAALFNVLSLLAVPLAGVLWAGLVPDADTDKTGASSVYLIAGAALFLTFGLAYYVPLDMNLGFESSAVLGAAGVLLGLFGVIALTRGRAEIAVGDRAWVLAAAAAVLPFVAFVVAIGVDTFEETESKDPLRFVSYNVHSAFNTDGALDVEAIAQVIEDIDADVVGLQEVPRGQLLSATIDLLTLLELELGFEHVAYFGTTDPVWGNAILSRYPITDVGTDYLPLVGTPMQRGYLGATVSVGDAEVLVISTHLQHLNDPDVHDLDPEADLLPVHTEQIDTILRNWGGQMPAVLMGDFNARPEWAQIQQLEDAGWVDAWDEVGVGPGFTSNAANPRYRIDYVFHTNDIVGVDAGVFQSTASDHFAVIADLSLE